MFPKGCFPALLASLVMLTGVHSAHSALIQFTDGFEGSSLDPFWQVSLTSGSYTLSTERAHNGAQSLKMYTWNSAAHKGVTLGHDFDAPAYGHMSIWFYDTGAGVPSSNAFALVANSPEARAVLGVWDYDFGRVEDYYRAVTKDWVTGVEETTYIKPRTRAWHEWEIECSSSTVTLTMDGSVAATWSHGLAFTNLSFYMGAPNWRPPFTSYWDDAEVQASVIPEPSTFVVWALLGGFGVVLVWDRRRRAA